MKIPGAHLGRFIFFTSLLVVSNSSRADVIFEEHFDSQADFTATMHTTEQSQELIDGDTLPTRWDALYQDSRWSPETGHPDRNAALEILAENADKARGGSGKSMVNWRESYDPGWLRWNSDSQLQKVFDQEYDEIYIEFWISFSSNWASRTIEDTGSSKIVRIGHYDGVGDPFNGAAGALGPILFWDYDQSQYGLGNDFGFRGGPPGHNYRMDEGAAGIDDLTNFTNDTIGMAVGGGNPQVVDQVNGGVLADIDRYDFVFHDQLWGPAGHWTKFGLYVKMNSAPGVQDGVMMQFINDQRIKHETTVPWVGASPENTMVGWNYIALGGNDFFRPYPNGDRFEDWYAIDDVVVRTSLPERLLSEMPSAPNPPADISIQ